MTELYRLFAHEPSVVDFLLEGSMDGLWYRDLKTQEHEWRSARFWQVLGYPPEEKQHLVSELQNIIFSEDLALAQENIHRHCLNPDFSCDQTLRFRHKNGSTVWMHCRGLIIRDGDGRPHRMLGIHQNVTKLKEAQSAYRELNERFNMLVDGVSVGIYERFDVEKNEEIWSPKFFELLGYSDKEIEASHQSFVDLLHPRDRDVVFSAMNGLIENEDAYDIEFRLKTKTGPYKWFRGTALVSRNGSGEYETQSDEASLSENGAEWNQQMRPLSVVGSIQDIDERKIYEDALEQAVVNLKQSNEELERFAYIASHDLQEPLRVISTYIQLLESRYAEVFDEEAEEFIGFTIDACKRMKELIKDLLEFSRLGKSSLETQEVDLEELMNSVTRSLVMNSDEGDINIRFSSLPTVRGNQGELERLLMNLVGNAVKYRHPERAVEVVVTARKNEHGLWCISVADNGIGIKERYFDTVFEIFQRLHSKSKYSGTGVGLAICKRIVNRHGGKIWLASIPGEGSTFFFTLH